MSLRLRPRRPGDLRIAWLWFAVSLAGIVLGPLLARAVWLLPRCGLKILTGWPCPTCGSSRALSALARLDAPEALRQNPLATGAAIAFLALGLLAPLVVHLVRKVPEAPAIAPRWLLAAVLLAGILNWVYLILAGA